MEIRVTLTGATQTYKTTVAGVTFANADGTNRQDLLQALSTGAQLRLVREPTNPHDRYAVAVYNANGQRLGYVPAGDAKLASHLDSGGSAAATVVAVVGGGGLLGKLFSALRRPYGCVVEITKTGPDWSRVQPYMDRSAEIERTLQDAHASEDSDRPAAIAAYRKAVADIVALDSIGSIAAAWRRARYPVNRLSMLLEHNRDYRAALEVIEAYERYRDVYGIGAADGKAVALRKARLQSKLSGGAGEA